MKKLFAIIALSALLPLNPVLAATARIVVPDNVGLNESFSAQVNIEDAEDLHASRFLIDFDKDLLEFNDATIGDLMDLGCDNLTPGFQTTDTGLHFYVDRGSCEGAYGNGTAVNLNFTAKGESGTSGFNFITEGEEKSYLNDSEGMPISTIWENSQTLIDEQVIPEEPVVDVMITPADQTVSVGDNVAVAVTVEDAIDLNTVDLALTFDNTILTFVGVTPSETLNDNGWTLYDPFEYESGLIMVSMDGLEGTPINNNQTLVIFNFTAINSGTSYLNFEPDFNFLNFGDLAALWNNGNVTVNQVVAPPVEDTMEVRFSELYELDYGSSSPYWIKLYRPVDVSYFFAEFTYNTDVLSYKNFESGITMAPEYEDWMLDVFESTPGTVTVMMDGTGALPLSNPTEDILMVALDFEAVGYGMSTFDFTENPDTCLVTNEAFEPYVVEWENREVTVTDNQAPIINIILPTNEDVYYYENADPTITVSGTATDNVGFVSFGSTISNDAPGGVGGGGHGLPTPDPEINFIYDFTLYEGENIITISGTDEAGNSANDIITIYYSLPDTTAPVITLVGENPVNIYVGDTYNDAGATATDDTDGNITANIIAVNPVDTDTVGTYTITYNVSDAAGNHATEASRTINVQDPPPPPPPLPEDTTAPVRTNGAPTGTLSAGTANANLTLTTDEPATCRYSTTVSTPYEDMTGTISAAMTTAHTLALSGLANDTNYKYYVRCADESGNFNTDDYEISFYVDKPAAPAGSGGGSSSGGGGGGGGGGGSSASSVSNPDSGNGVGGGSIDQTDEELLATPENTSIQADNEERAENNVDEHQGNTSLIGADGPTVEKVTAHEAGQIHANADFVELNDTTRKIYEKIITGAPELSDNTKYAIAYFIHQGTATTQRLGAGERAGALNSYIAAFGKYPVFANEWQDVVKIANGRWPTERSESAEKRAKTSFELIYKRPADMNQQNDNAAVTVMAYGLRPAQRNTESEKAAIKTFEHIFNGSPKTAIDWDIVRAIAYSGAIR
ncbi:MAG: immunoglobulin-like domain-containing protein [Candidatus Falkowbacteria bacterium]